MRLIRVSGKTIKSRTTRRIGNKVKPTSACTPYIHQAGIVAMESFQNGSCTVGIVLTLNFADMIFRKLKDYRTDTVPLALRWAYLAVCFCYFTGLLSGPVNNNNNNNVNVLFCLHCWVIIFNIRNRGISRNKYIRSLFDM